MDQACEGMESVAESTCGCEEGCFCVSDPFAASPARIQSYLCVLEAVRRIVSEDVASEEHRKVLLGTWRLRAEKREQYLGHCVCKHEQWRLVGQDRKQSLVNRLRAVYVRVERHGSRRVLPFTVCVATLLHEMAHAITPGELVFTSTPPADAATGRNPTKRRKAQWYFDAHSSRFYDNFAMLLRIAERRRLFVLPPRADKYSMRALRRFDDRDVDVIPPPASCAPLLVATDGSLCFSNAQAQDQGLHQGLAVADPSEVQRVARHTGSLRINVSAMRRKRMVKKTGVVPERTLEAIKRHAAAKVGMKTVHSIKVERDGQHVELDEAVLETLGSEVSIVVS
eukprot:TRINITY_DN1043_c0_g1_i1.p1 TRINITY_DN1043_c0_g1~~TRINITY_DN1043_c0_g1_i1.p1  ORF type:complete len:393 (+),score=101.97 TRINITY_DN1043_c0_g1_i1:163-1179(+)